MQGISTAKELREAILILEAKKVMQEEELKSQAKQVIEDLKPGNLISNALQQPRVQNKLMNASVALATGYLSKRLLFGPAAGPIQKIAGGLLQWGVTAIAGKNFSKIREKVGNFLRRKKS